MGYFKVFGSTASLIISLCNLLRSGYSIAMCMKVCGYTSVQKLVSMIERKPYYLESSNCAYFLSIVVSQIQFISKVIGELFLNISNIIQLIQLKSYVQVNNTKQYMNQLTLLNVLTFKERPNFTVYLVKGELTL